MRGTVFLLPAYPFCERANELFGSCDRGRPPWVQAGTRLAMRFLRDAYLAIKRDTLVLAFDVFFAD